VQFSFGGKIYGVLDLIFITDEWRMFGNRDWSGSGTQESDKPSSQRIHFGVDVLMHMMGFGQKRRR
jgi:hypothetical protein